MKVEGKKYKYYKKKKKIKNMPWFDPLRRQKFEFVFKYFGHANICTFR